MDEGEAYNQGCEDGKNHMTERIKIEISLLDKIIKENPFECIKPSAKREALKELLEV